MGTTPLGLPFPEGQDQPQVHLDIKALAEASQAVFGRIAAASFARTTDDSTGSTPGNVATATLTGVKAGQIVVVMGVARTRQNTSSGNQTWEVRVGGQAAGGYLLGSVPVQSEDVPRPCIGLLAAPTDNPTVQMVGSTSGGTVTLRTGSRVVGFALPTPS
jgi:hypothetical protein